MHDVSSSPDLLRIDREDEAVSGAFPDGTALKPESLPFHIIPLIQDIPKFGVL